MTPSPSPGPSESTPTGANGLSNAASTPAVSERAAKAAAEDPEFAAALARQRERELEEAQVKNLALRRLLAENHVEIPDDETLRRPEFLHDRQTAQLQRELQQQQETLRAELVAKVREEIGAVASFHDVTVVEALPKTRSGKILRKTMRQIADGRDDVAIPSTIEDPGVLDALAPVLRELGGDSR